MLKGKAKIELTDVNTGKVEVYEHDNLVTNAVSDILSYNPCGMRFRNYSNTNTDELGASFQAGLLPVVPKLIGGILLFENELENDPEKYYADANNPLIGYSSNNVNTSSNSLRGSMNQTESGKLAEGNGYKFVFDFTTSQANGTISSLALTSARGGLEGRADPSYSSVGHKVLCVDRFVSGTVSGGINQLNLGKIFVTSIEPENNLGYFAYVSAAKTVHVGKIRIPFTDLGLFDSYSPEWTILEDITLTTISFASTYSTSSYFYGTLIDGDDGYIWGFQHSGNAAGNTSGNANILWIKINKIDWTFEEGNWVLDAQLVPFGQYYTGRAWDVRYFNNAMIKDGILYAHKNNGSDSNLNYANGMYMINLTDITDIKVINYDASWWYPHSYYHTSDNRAGHYVTTTINEVAGTITCGRWCIVNGRPIRTDIGTNQSSSRWSHNECLCDTAKPRLRYGPYMVCIAASDSGYYDTARYETGIYLPMMYLATINNLETPIVKTSDKTMKITYVLKEE